MAEIVESLFVDKKKFAFALIAFFGAGVFKAVGLLDIPSLSSVLIAVIYAYLIAQGTHDAMKAFKGEQS